MNYKLVKQENAPEEVKEWINENKTVEGNKIVTINDMTYVVISRGEKKTGGYGIEIDCKEKDNSVEILVKYINPKKDQIMIQVLTYPLIIIKFKKTIKEVILTYENTI